MQFKASCVDKLSNCASYTTSVCTDSSYDEWVTNNCPKFCNRCGSSGGQMTYPVPSFTCVDKLPNCASYGQSTCTLPDFTKWVTDNCPKYCNKCACMDTIPNCADYTTSVCSSADFASWVGTHCAKFCQKCHSATSMGTVPQVPSSGGQTGSSSGCVYAGHVYQQGQTWKDGCKFSCSCVDGSTGKYQCSSLCVQWNLPQQCHMNPAPSGMCCPTPNCPAGFVIKYPAGYVAH